MRRAINLYVTLAYTASVAFSCSTYHQLQGAKVERSKGRDNGITERDRPAVNFNHGIRSSSGLRSWIALIRL